MVNLLLDIWVLGEQVMWFNLSTKKVLHLSRHKQDKKRHLLGGEKIKYLLHFIIIIILPWCHSKHLLNSRRATFKLLLQLYVFYLFLLLYVFYFYPFNNENKKFIPPSVYPIIIIIFILILTILFQQGMDLILNWQTSPCALNAPMSRMQNNCEN